jgi:hypothetical protein
MHFFDTITGTGDSGSLSHVKLGHQNSGLVIEAELNAATETLSKFPLDKYAYVVILTKIKDGKRQYELLGRLDNSKQDAPELENPDHTVLTGILEASSNHYESIVIATRSLTNLRENLHPIVKLDWPEDAPTSSHSQSIDTATSDATSPDTDSPQTPAWLTYYPRSILQHCIAIARAADKYQTVAPFKDYSQKFQWKKVTDALTLPILSYGCYKPLSIYGHFLFSYDDSHYLIGIPGMNASEEQPDEGKSGFTSWLPIEGQDTYGYWIATVNRYNGYIEELPLIDD